MKISFKLEHLIDALDNVSIVSPRPVTSGGGAGYLFVVREGQCSVYSRDDLCVARANLPLESFDSDGMLVYPAECISAFRFLAQNDSSCTLESTLKDDKHFVSYETESGVRVERSSFDPQLLSTCDEDLEGCADSGAVSSGLLKEAFKLAKPFMAEASDSKAQEHLKGVQVLDVSKYPKGDGFVFAADGIRAFYFYSDALKGKSLEVHGQHLSALMNFLGKCDKEVTFKKGAHFTFAVSEAGPVFGWPRYAKQHEKFSYYAKDRDSYVLKINKARVLNSLMHVRKELDNTRDKVKLKFDADRNMMCFMVNDGPAKVDGIPFKVDVVQSKNESFVAGVNINQAIELFNNAKGFDVELRVLVMAVEAQGKQRSVFLFRTLDEFYLDASGKVTVEPEGASKCIVTRMMPSKD